MAVDGQQDLDESRQPDDKPQSFRSPIAAAVWWLWVLFAVGNLIDLAIQGRSHSAAVAAAVLVFVSGVVYVTAQLPRVLSTGQGVTIRNPLRDHAIGWGSITKVDTLDLLRVYCEWPGTDGAPRRKVFHAWAVQHSRRREMAERAREQRRARGGLASSRPDGVPSTGFGSVTGPGGTAGYAVGDRDRQQPAIGTPRYAVESLKARLAEARGRQLAATAPESTWRWTAIAMIVLPAILLAIVAAV